MAERLDLLPQGGQWYKANLHCHTTVSDGRLTPEEVKAAYQEQGYQVVAYTDHRKYVPHLELCDEAFIALAGVEIDISEILPGKDWFFMKMYHLNFYDTQPEQMPDAKAMYCAADYWDHDPVYVNSYIRKMRQLGFIACYNHPYWSNHTVDDYLPLEGLFAMEIYNHACELEGAYGYTPQAYQEMLRAGKRIGCVASDDNHDFYPFGHPLCDSFGGYTMIYGEKLTYGEIIRNLQAGNYYSTTGSKIRELYLEDGMLVIKTSPAERIYVHTKGEECYREISRNGEALTEAGFLLSGKEGYLQVTVQDSKKGTANSNAYFLDELPGGTLN